MQSHYKIAFIGFGSIAHRHLFNVVAYLNNNRFKYQIDIVRSGLGKSLDESTKQHITDVYNYNDKIPNNYDIIFITNPTSCHYVSIIKYAANTKYMFIEKPVFDQTDVDLSSLSKNTIYYVACPLRYTNVLKYIKENVDCNKAYSIRAISSSYLPNWRSGVDYRNTYSAHKDLGGGVSIDLIHEWDYIISLVGFPQKVISFVNKVSNLEIDSDDIALYIGIYNDKTVEIHLDYFGQQTIRELELYLPSETIKADLINKKIVFLKSGTSIDLHEDRDTVQLREIEHFFNIVNGKDYNDNTIDDALKTLRIAKGKM